MWPENWPPFQLYYRFRRQWRMGFNGPIGLDYNVIQHELSRKNIPPDDYDDLMACIQIIEEAALDEFKKDG